MARAIHLGDVPPLRLGFSSFINANLLQAFRESDEETFPGCEIQLAGGDPVLILQRLNQRLLDARFSRCPLIRNLSTCNKSHSRRWSSACAVRTLWPAKGLLDIHRVADRIYIFRYRELRSFSSLSTGRNVLRRRNLAPLGKFCEDAL